MMRLVTLLCLAFVALPSRAQADERKVLGQNHLEPVENAKGTPAYTDALPVARVEDAGDDEVPGYAFCTASQVGPHLFLTNAHCEHECGVMLFRLGYERDIPASGQQLYRCKQLLAQSETYDYALYEVEPADDATPEVAFPILTLSRAPLVAGEPLYLASHPAGRFKELDRSDTCKVADAALFESSGRQTVKHLCDSEGGSSGAPLLDRATGHAVGLHWGGKDGQYNMAIPMALIVGDLQKQLPADVLQKLKIVD